MLFEKKCAELVELYDNSGKEFYQELAALLANIYPDAEHTILECSKEKVWKVAATTLQDPDEIRFLVIMAKQEAVNTKRNSFQFSSARENVRGHLVIPLSIRNREMTGIWIMENRWNEKISADKEVLRFGKLLALFLQASSDEKSSMFNRYIDAETGLLGKRYFSWMAERILLKTHKVTLCCIRWNEYREMVRIKGSAEAEARILKLIRDVKHLELGNCYMLAEDTLVIISVEPKQEIYARLERLAEEPLLGPNLKIAMIDLVRQTDLLAYIEELFCMCNPGIIWLRDQNPVADLFAAGPNSGNEESLEDEQEAEDVVEELLGFLEREYAP